MSVESNIPEYRFSDLHNRTDIVVREHFENYADIHDFHTVSLVNVFHAVVNGLGVGSLTQYRQRDSRPSKWEQIREPVPLEGIQLVKRSDAGINAYRNLSKIQDPNNKVLTEYGMTAESLVISAIRAYRTPKVSPNTVKVLNMFAEELGGQLH